MSGKNQEIVVRALRTTQGDNLDVYALFIRGSDLVRIADISRISRDDSDTLKGFQRPEIRSHVKGIINYLNQGDVLFPNAIILALSPEIKFMASRGSKPTGDEGIAQAGTLRIPLHAEGLRSAWIVDGQQRALALAKANNADLPVPVVGFVSDNLTTQREQFILVNKAKPLPTRLINELLPETGSILLPRELSARKAPAELCGLLNRDPRSPFYRLIKLSSDRETSDAVVTDTAIIKMIRTSMTNPLGALYPYKSNDEEKTDVEAMYQLLVLFWRAVKECFPNDWALDPKESRLMHSAGIAAMGYIMDLVCAKISGQDANYSLICKEVEKIAPRCAWSSGKWPLLNVAWNEVQSTPQDIKHLQDTLLRIYMNSSRA
ncbi:DGQHR domain-containing protein [Pseudomonas argentinensis]|uniref:DGQHR domain-containing protein n=1 Tax=Phytopseudomonas argentinensis TaxID=289370 RepID=A0A1I3GKK6_9GAMM|nr:DGQHR domain-containing protein DpdB [Pseudomonas argentinensis]KAB0549069.1 DGQHR domain-containing protein [Pseudomonas argentinensis]SFI23960.1 DGQHR domain-containing protein [Pseudomonas argentinensis]